MNSGIQIDAVEHGTASLSANRSAWMPLRTIAGCKNLNNRRWCEHCYLDSAGSLPPFPIPCRRPEHHTFSLDRPGGAVTIDHRAIGQIVNRYWMFAFEVSIEAFRVQNAIDLGSAGPSIRIRTIGPERGEALRIFSAALEARPVTGGKRRDFVEKEKLRVVFPPHVAVTPVEFQSAADPGPTDVPPLS